MKNVLRLSIVKFLENVKNAILAQKNPAIWAFENIRNSILKSMKVNPGLNNWHREQSESVRYRIDGCYMPDKPYTLQEAKNIVVIHPIVGCYISRHSHQVSTKDITKVTLHFYRWTDNGMTSYKKWRTKQNSYSNKGYRFSC